MFSVIDSIVELGEHHLITHISTTLDWLKHLVELTWMFILKIMLLL